MNCQHLTWDEMATDGTIGAVPAILHCRSCGLERRLVRRGLLQSATVTCPACDQPLRIDLTVIAVGLDGSGASVTVKGYANHPCKREATP